MQETVIESNEDFEAIKAVQTGRRERFSVLVDKYKRRAYLIAFSLVSNREDAMDLAQDAFLKSFRAIKEFDISRPFFPWFYRILKNTCLSHLKRKKLIKKFSLSATESGESDIELPDQTFDPQMIVDRNEAKEQIWEAFNRLNLKSREIIMFRHFQDMSYDEIAKALDIPIGTVMSRLFHARRQMKEMIEKYL